MRRRKTTQRHVAVHKMVGVLHILQVKRKSERDQTSFIPSPHCLSNQPVILPFFFFLSAALGFVSGSTSEALRFLDEEGVEEVDEVFLAEKGFLGFASCARERRNGQDPLG